MRVLYLGKPSPVLDYLRDVEDEAGHWGHPIRPEHDALRKYDFLVSYGYRHKIPADVLALFPHRAINLHASFLPWNRGAYPNAWAWYDGTYQGVTIHELDEGWDTGPVLARRVRRGPDNGETRQEESVTLASEYHLLQNDLEREFMESWPKLKSGHAVAFQPQEAGSFHTKADFDRMIAPLLTDGWRTPVSVLAEAGRKARDSA